MPSDIVRMAVAVGKSRADEGSAELLAVTAWRLVQRVQVAGTCKRRATCGLSDILYSYVFATVSAIALREFKCLSLDVSCGLSESLKNSRSIPSIMSPLRRTRA